MTSERRFSPPVTQSSLDPAGDGVCSNGDGRAVMHKVWRADTGERRLCCECHVGEGAPPADWHPLCMEAYRARQRLT